MLRRVSLIALLLSLTVCGSVFANPMILAPTGNTLGTGQVRVEAAFSPGDDEGRYYWLATGLLQVEASLIRFEPPVGEEENILSLQWNFLPETLFTPGIGFGVYDAADETEEGIGVYAVATRHLPIGRFSRIIQEFAVTAGVGFGGIDGPFAGVEVGLPYNLFVQAEYDSHDFNGAVGWQPVPLFRVKAYTIRDEVYYGAELVPVSF